jgi:dephospho-CoA kinase
MIVAGITGGIGSGKSTVCKEWEKLGAKIFYADDEAKRLMVSDKTVINELRRVFGDETYHKDGSLNKPHLISEAFEKGRVEELNQIVHPAVARHFRAVCKKEDSEGNKLIVKEAALLLNSGRPEEMDVVVIVVSDINKRLKRVAERDNVSTEKVRERDAKQPDFENLLHLADIVIENNGTVEELKNRSVEVYYQIVKKYKN